MSEQRHIDNQTYYHAMALYILARRKQAEVDKLEFDLNKLLDTEDGSHLSDAIYEYENLGTKEEFDNALNKMNVVVENH